MSLFEELEEYRNRYDMNTNGKLSMILTLTRRFSQDNLPIRPESYKTNKKGQISLLSGDRTKAILAEYGIFRTLSKEGGRTTRGGMEYLQAYARLVNSRYERNLEIDFEEMEEYWIKRIKIYFNSQPLRLNLDNARSFESTIDDLILQARKRDSENVGSTSTGKVLQHLVAAKLCSIIPNIEINGADVADAPTGRSGDFMVGDVAIHCTTSPSNLLIGKCAENIRAGINPVIITIRERVLTARSLADDAGIGNRIEVWDIQQFLSTNIYEHGLFERSSRQEKIEGIIEKYNEIVSEHETDPSLSIRLD